MGTASETYSKLDDQIFACIEQAKTGDKDAKLEDFQLRIVAADLVLFNLKTRRTYVINDDDSELLDLPPALGPIAAAEPPQTRASMAISAASIAVRSGSRLVC